MKLQSKFFNNIFLGGRKGPSREEKLARLTSENYDSVSANIAVTGYLAEWSFAGEDTKPTGLPALPEQPGEYFVDDLPTFAQISMADGSTLGSNLDLFTDAKLWTAIDYEDGYLRSFTRKNAVYGAVGDYYEKDEKDEMVLAPDQLLDGNTYYWIGWGVMYYDGIKRPDLPSGYPEEGLGEVIISQNRDIFTFDYVETSMEFVYHETFVDLVKTEFIK